MKELEYFNKWRQISDEWDTNCQHGIVCIYDTYSEGEREKALKNLRKLIIEAQHLCIERAKGFE